MKLRRVTARVFDDADALMFEVRTVTQEHRIPAAQFRVIGEAKQRIQTGDWLEAQVYAI
jgi:hypothetical protein